MCWLPKKSCPFLLSKPWVVLQRIYLSCVYFVCLFVSNVKMPQCPGQHLHPLQSCVVWHTGGSLNRLPLLERECEHAAVLPTRACHSMPGTVGVSRMALWPIWPITQAGLRRFQRDPAATWSTAVSIGVSGRLGKKGQSPAGPSETDISARRAATLPLTHSHAAIIQFHV